MASALGLLESGFPERLDGLVRVQCERTHGIHFAARGVAKSRPAKPYWFTFNPFENGGKVMAERVGIRSRAVVASTLPLGGQAPSRRRGAPVTP